MALGVLGQYQTVSVCRGVLTNCFLSALQGGERPMMQCGRASQCPVQECPLMRYKGTVRALRTQR